MAVFTNNINQSNRINDFIGLLYDQIYTINILDNTCTEHKPQNCSALNIQNYDELIITLARKMYKADAAMFFAKMTLSTITDWLAQPQNTRYIVNFQLNEDNDNLEYQLSICYFDSTQTKLLLGCQHLQQQDSMTTTVAHYIQHCDNRFRFVIDHNLVTYIEIKVKTGVCQMFSENNKMPAYGTLKEQIAWWADHIIIPAEREAYIKEFDLKNLLQTLRTHHNSHSVIYTANYNGIERQLLIVSTLVKETHGAAEEYIFAYSQDVTLLKEQEKCNKQLVDISQQLLNLSQTESVTGLYNRLAFEKQLEKFLSTNKVNTDGTLLLIDIDYFKKFNDLYGHQIGDFVLKYLSKSLQNVFRSDDILCRWGGDEFIIFMHDINTQKNITSRIERLRAKMQQCKTADIKLTVTLSIGGVITKPGMDMKVLFEKCDKALYKVKNDGRNGFYIDFT